MGFQLVGLWAAAWGAQSLWCFFAGAESVRLRWLPPVTMGTGAAEFDVHRPKSVLFQRVRNPPGLPSSTCAVQSRRFSSGCEARPASFAPAGSNLSSHGGNEMAEAFGVEGH